MTDKASGGIMANARQLMYAARGQLQELTGQIFKGRTDQHITQRIIPDFIRDHPEETAHWDVLYDARGHFREPHTGDRFGLGTLEVRSYESQFEEFGADWKNEICLQTPEFELLSTCGPQDRFGGVLFCEKEGFYELFKRAKIQERYDVAFMSTKGNSVTAARRLADALAGYADRVLGRPLPLYTLHDLDVSGFVILGTFLNSGRRYTYENELIVHDLGLRLDDVREMNLESEEVLFGKQKPTIQTLAVNGAASEEIHFLLGERRVELNSMTSPQIIELIESKFAKHGVKKVIPDDDTLAQAFRNIHAQQQLNNLIESSKAGIIKNVTAMEIPETLRAQVQNVIQNNQSMAWDAALSAVITTGGK